MKADKLMKKKWIIKGISKSTPFCKAGRVVLASKLRKVFKLIEKFFEDDSVEILHEMRIAFRRFRYVIEIFYLCYDDKLFRKVYSKAKFLQDLIGEGRDLDVISEKVRHLAKDSNTEIPDSFFTNIDKSKKIKREEIKVELLNFTNNKEVLKFLKKK